ncbi:MAG TPA: hypothetical protein VK988_02390 [Acidimicrobiales bacterium]|nr:hypothetical protein [Acidimicrobiales bacterium]
MDVEEATVRAFMLRDRRDRWIASLSTARRRRKATDRLAHLRDLDPRYAHRLEPSGQQSSVILDELRRRGAPATCHVISENTSLDARDLPLEDILDEVVGSMHGTIVICVAGELAYYEGEDQGERYILERPGGAGRY